MPIKTITLPRQTRNLMSTPGSLNEEDRTAEVVWTTSAPCRRWDWELGEYWEVLSMTPEAVDMRRLLNGAPVLDSHENYSTDAVIGRTETARLEGDKGIATLRFAKDDERADKIWNKVRQNILTGVSIGYDIQEAKITEANGERTLTATRWEPFEISIVAVPADAAAGIRNAGQRMSACVIKSRAAAQNKPKQIKRKEHKKMKKRFKREIGDLNPDQVSEVAEIVDDEASKIGAAVEEAVTALDEITVEVPAEVTEIVESLSEAVDSITTETETQINEIMDDEEPPPAEDETRSAQIMELCDIAGLSARDARSYIRGKMTPQEVSKDLLRQRAAKASRSQIGGKGGDGSKSAKSFADYVIERNKK